AGGRGGGGSTPSVRGLEEDGGNSPIPADSDRARRKWIPVPVRQQPLSGQPPRTRVQMPARMPPSLHRGGQVAARRHPSRNGLHADRGQSSIPADSDRARRKRIPVPVRQLL